MTTPTELAAEFDPHAPAFADDPYPFYAALRAEGRVRYVPSIDEWWVTHYDDTRAMLEDRRLSHRLPREAATPVPIAALGGEPLPPPLLRLDPPDHTRLRALVTRAFTPHVVAGLRGRIEAIAAGLLDQAAARGRMDLVGDLAVPLPVVVIAELLGVPAADRDRFKSWSTPLAQTLDPTQPLAVRLQAAAAVQALAAYFSDLIAERQRQPRADLVSELLAVEEQGDRLNRGELLSMCILLLVAGHETTTNLVASGLFSLLRHPDQLELVRRRRELVPNAVEEALRYESPIQRARHSTKEPTEIAGTLVPGGAVVTAVIGSANRDAAAFPEPDRFDVERADVRHLAFGRGPHFCLGAPLARLEGAVAFTAVLDRFPAIELEDPRPAWSGNTTVRALRSLPVRL